MHVYLSMCRAAFHCCEQNLVEWTGSARILASSNAAASITLSHGPTVRSGSALPWGVFNLSAAAVTDLGWFVFWVGYKCHLKCFSAQQAQGFALMVCRALAFTVHAGECLALAGHLLHVVAPLVVLC